MKTFYPDKVAVSAQSVYDAEKTAEILRAHFKYLGIDASFFSGKKVAVKPNLVMKKSPDFAATTHPSVLDGLLTVLSEMGCTPVIAESPGGVYSESRLDSIYRACGIDAVAKKHGAVLNYNTESGTLYFDGALVKSFNIIKPLADADIIIDLCKLKSHSLTAMSGAVKNFFGAIPGIEKFEQHAAYPDYKDFTSMLCDLCAMFCETKKIISVTDAVIGMEGNGPTAGVARKIGCIITSENPFASDLLSESIIGFTGQVPTVAEGTKRGYTPENADRLSVSGDYGKELYPENFLHSDANKGSHAGLLLFFSQGRIGRIFMPHPEINYSKCRSCGECSRSCPQKTIRFENGRAEINLKNCIRCYCCQELCPFGAIRVKRNFITKLISKIK